MVPILNADPAKQQRIENIVNEYPYIEIFTLNTAEIEKDDATVDAFKRFLDTQLLNEGVDRFEVGDTILYGMKTRDTQAVHDQLSMPEIWLEYQPWFERYFTSVYSYEDGSKEPEDAFARMRENDADGWDKHILDDEFFPKR